MCDNNDYIGKQWMQLFHLSVLVVTCNACVEKKENLTVSMQSKGSVTLTQHYCMHGDNVHGIIKTCQV